jgi:hypothetical protein
MALQAAHNKKNAESTFRKNHPSAKGKKLSVEYMYTDPPFRMYEIEIVGRK